MNNEFFLYKYFNVDGSIPSGLSRLQILSDILVTKEIFVPSLELLNDPFEAIINSQTEGQNKINDPRGVLSFTTNDRNILMWAHYSGSHTGVAVKFKIKRESIHRFQKVQYIQDQEELSTLDSILVKSSAWSYENEYRVVFKNSSMKISLNEFGLSVEGLMIGFKTPSQNKEHLKNICLATDVKYGEIKLTSNFSCEIGTLKTIEDHFIDDFIQKERDEEMRENFSSYLEQDHEYPDDDYDPYEHYTQAAESSEEFKSLINRKEELKKKLIGL